MKMTSFQIILLSVFGVFAVVGVLIFAFAVGNTNGKSVGAVKIWGTINQATFNEFLLQLSQNDQSLSQVTYEHQDVKTYEDTLTRAIAAGTGPDLFLMSQSQVVHDAGEVIPIPFTSLSQTQFQNTFMEAAVPFLGSAGVLAVPVAADPLILYWNKDILASGGYSQPPQYWDQLPDMVDAITQKNDAGTITRGTIAFGEYDNVNDAKDIFAMLIMQAGGTITKIGQDGKLSSTISQTNGGTIAPALSALSFYTQFANPAQPTFTWQRSLPDAQSAFAAGDVALYIGYASERSLIARKNPNLNFAVAVVPQIRNGAKVVNVSRLYGFALARGAKNPTGALTVAYTLSSAANSERFAQTLGVASARRDILGKAVTGDQLLLHKAAIASYSWTDPDPDATASLFRSMISDTTSGATTLPEAITRADSQMAHIISLLTH